MYTKRVPFNSDRLLPTHTLREPTPEASQTASESGIPAETRPSPSAR